jgi:CheY-like chemotaxis protein
MGLLAFSAPRIASRVLLVDDDKYVRDVTALILERMGYRVRATGNGFEALRWLEEEAYDLLVLDVKMPEIDGPTLYRAVLARWPTDGPRILFVTGFAEMPDYEAVLQAGDVPVLLKPFTLDELKAALDRVLATV